MSAYSAEDGSWYKRNGKDTLEIYDPIKFLQFLKDGIFSPTLRVHKGKQNTEYYIPEVYSRVEEKNFRIKKVFPKGLEIFQVETHGSKYLKVDQTPEEFEKAWEEIVTFWCQELLRIKGAALEAENPVYQPCLTAKSISEKVLTHYSDFDVDHFRAVFLLNMVWLIKDESATKYGLSLIPSFPIGGKTIKKLGGDSGVSKKRKLEDDL